MSRRARPQITGGFHRGHSAAHRIELGVYAQNQEDRFKTSIEARGGTVTWHRLYFQGQDSSGMGLVSTRAAAGFKVYVSFRPNGTTWEQIAAGNEDSRWSDIGTFLGGISNAGAWCFNHEPENDRATFGSDANGDAFRAAFDQVASIIKPLAPDWLASACLFDELFPSWASEFGSRGGNWQATPDPARWIPSSIDLLGVDYYAYRGASDGGSHWAVNSHVYDHRTAYADYLSYAATPVCSPEFGYVIKDPGTAPTDVDNQIAWLQDFASVWAGNARLRMFCWFEVNEQDNAGKGNYSITDDDHPPMNTDTVDAFVSFGA